MAMIELIFAIVVIAISLLSIPSMMAVAAQSSKGSVIDEDVMSRLSGWVMDKSQARWDGNYSASGSGPLWIPGDLNCTSRGSGNVWYRVNADSTVQCDDQNRTPSAILSSYPDGNLSRGIERLNGGSENLEINTTSAESYTITASYAVSYVPSTVSVSGNTATATWVLGSSTAMEPSPSVAATHLKRVVTRFSDPDTQTDMVLTFFKSNKGN
jgi:hypothetical protein